MKLFINQFPISAAFGSIDPSHPIPHKGMDIAMPQGTPVESIGNGIVTAVIDEGSRSFGKAVHLHLENGYDVIYGHLTSFSVSPGQHVRTGQTIGYSGSTGDSTGPHLHLQMMMNGHTVDPASFLKQSDWNLFEIVKHPLEYASLIGHQFLSRISSGFDEIALIAVCSGVLGVMLSIPNAGKFTQAAIGVYVIIKIWGMVLNGH